MFASVGAIVDGSTVISLVLDGPVITVCCDVVTDDIVVSIVTNCTVAISEDFCIVVTVVVGWNVSTTFEIKIAVGSNSVAVVVGCVLVADAVG